MRIAFFALGFAIAAFSAVAYCCLRVGSLDEPDYFH